MVPVRNNINLFYNNLQFGLIIFVYVGVSDELKSVLEENI